MGIEVAEPLSILSGFEVVGTVAEKEEEEEEKVSRKAVGDGALAGSWFLDGSPFTRRRGVIVIAVGREGIVIDW